MYCFDFKRFDRLKNLVKQPNDLISPYMQTSLKTIKKYLPYIKNTFSCYLTNAIIEGINNRINIIKRIAFGYRSFLHPKNRILISKNLLKIKAA